MTDSSSDTEAATDMVKDLISASKDTPLTHMIRIGAFHMEIVPNEGIDIEKFFTETMKRIFKEFPEQSRFWKCSDETNGKHYG